MIVGGGRGAWQFTLVVLSAQSIGAQSRPSVADTSHFRALALPTPNEYRASDGRPGPKYWQQKVDYRIEATLDQSRNEIRGAETIHYVNHSPSTLSYAGFTGITR